MHLRTVCGLDRIGRHGDCNSCNRVDAVVDQYGTVLPKREEALRQIASQIMPPRKGLKYDCAIGVSG